MVWLGSGRLASVVGIAAVCAGLLLASPALATCTALPDVPTTLNGSGSTYCTTANITNPTNEAVIISGSGITLTNPSPFIMTNSGSANINISDQTNGNTLNNQGTITSTTANNIFIGTAIPGASNSITNSGTLSSTFTGGGANSIYFYSNSNLGNTGNITTNENAGSGSMGVFVNGDSNTITNTGTISESGGAAGSAAVILSGDGNTVENAGTVSETGGADTDGPFAISVIGANNTITNQEGGQITSPSVVTINVTGPNTAITNSGSVSSAGGGKDMIFFINSGNITNTATGSILANAQGGAANGEVTAAIRVNADVLIKNELGGAINSTSNAVAICVQSYGTSTVTNAGTITALSTSANNVAYGIVVLDGTAPNNITNTGTITAQGGDGSASHESFDNDAGSAGIWHAGTGSTITNSGTISETGGAVGSAGIILSNTGNIINNTGTISETFAYASGAVTGSAAVIFNSSGALSNAVGATLTSTSQNAVIVGSGGAGAIITNRGNITTTLDGADNPILLNGQATIDNYGNIGSSTGSGNGDNGIVINADATITNQAGGTITVTNFNNATGVQANAGTNSVLNQGLITALSTAADHLAYGLSTSGGTTTITNNGTITATGGLGGSAAINFASNGNTLTNSGTSGSPSVISETGGADGSAGVIISGNGNTVNNQAYGQITETGTGGTNPTNGASGILISGASNIINNQANGTISQGNATTTLGTGITLTAGDNTINNYGTISGNPQKLTGGTITTLYGVYMNATGNVGNTLTNNIGGTISAYNGLTMSAISSSNAKDVVTNYGTITSGTGGHAATISLNGSSFTNEVGGVVQDIDQYENWGEAISTSSAPMNITNAGTIASAATYTSSTTSYSILSQSVGGNLTNSGNITSSSTAGQSIGFYGWEGGGVTVTNTGNITASGTIPSAGVWLTTDNNALTSTGTAQTPATISETGGVAGSAGVFLCGDNNSVTNNAYSTISGVNNGSGILITGGGKNSVQNAINGTISTSGTSYAPNAIGITGGANHSIVNNGNITSTAYGGSGIMTEVNGSITNSGTISVTNTNYGNAILAQGTGVVAIENSGTLSTTTTVASNSSTNGIYFDGSATGTIANTNIINASGGAVNVAHAIATANPLSGTININNSGNISANGKGGSAGISFVNNNNIITNSGTISETGGAAGSAGVILAGNSNTLNNANGGTISEVGGTDPKAWGVLFNGNNNTLNNAYGGTISCGFGTSGAATAYGVGSPVGSTGNTINNSGVISAKAMTGGQAVAIDGTATLTNSETGQIAFVGGEWAMAFAAEANGNVTLINRGLISATATNDTGNFHATAGVIYNGTGSITNSGTISANNSGGFSAQGVSIQSTGNVIFNNSGIITASGAGGSAGISFVNNGNTITNHGTISETGGAAGSAGVIISSTGNTVNNHGSISGAVGIIASGASNTIDNHGTISGTSGIAVDMSGADNNTFNFHTTGHVIGKIKFSSGTGNTFNFVDKGSDRRYYIEYEGEATTNINAVDPILTISPSTITITSADSKQITTISKTTFVASSEIATQNARDVRNVIETRLDEFYLGRTRDHNRYNYWTKAFGTYQKRGAAGWALPYKTVTGGVAVGFDKPVRENISVGFFVNSNVGRLRYGDPAYTTTSKGVAIGSYGQIILPNDHFLEVMLSIGFNSIKNNSTVLQNISANGAVNIKSNNHDITALPSVSFGKRFEYDYFNMVPSVSLHYTAQRISAINEIASSPTLALQKVAARMLGTVGGKFQLALYNNETAEIKNTDFNLKMGIEAKKLVAGKTVKVTALGTEANFAAGGAKHHIDGFIGGGVNFKVGNAGKIYTEVEVSKSLINRSSKNMAASASLGIAFDF